MTIEKYNWLFEIYQKINFDKLPHGIIINGSNGIGKKLLANEIAAKLLINKSTNSLDRDLIESNSHPDLFIVDKDKIILRHITFRKSQKKEDWDEELGERNVNNFLSMSSSISLNKVVILFNALNKITTLLSDIEELMDKKLLTFLSPSSSSQSSFFCDFLKVICLKIILSLSTINRSG